MKIKSSPIKGKNIIVTETTDGFARADAKLITLINRVIRDCKGANIESSYHYETQYKKEEQQILQFDEKDTPQVIDIIRKNGYPVKNG